MTRLRRGGEDIAAATARALDEAPPTITFDPPTLGEPDFYTVTVRTLEDVLDAEGNILSRRRSIAVVQTEDTTVMIPADVLTAGSFYFFQVTASAGARLESPRRATSHQAAGARTATGVVTP